MNATWGIWFCRKTGTADFLSYTYVLSISILG